MIKTFKFADIITERTSVICAHTNVECFRSTATRKTPLPEKIDGSITGKKTKYRRHTLFSVVGLFLLPVFALPAHAASAVKTGQRVLMIEMTPHCVVFNLRVLVCASV